MWFFGKSGFINSSPKSNIIFHENGWFKNMNQETRAIFSLVGGPKHGIIEVMTGWLMFFWIDIDQITYMKRCFTSETLICDSSYAPKVCLCIVCFRHDHFRCLKQEVTFHGMLSLIQLTIPGRPGKLTVVSAKRTIKPVYQTFL